MWQIVLKISIYEIIIMEWSCKHCGKRSNCLFNMSNFSFCQNVLKSFCKYVSESRDGYTDRKTDVFCYRFVVCGIDLTLYLIGYGKSNISEIGILFNFFYRNNRRFLTSLQQTTFENSVAKGEIAPFATMFSTLLIVVVSFIKSSHIFC